MPYVKLSWTNKANVSADLQSAGIKYKDFNPLAFYFLLIGMSFGSKISFADRWFWYFMLSNFSLRSTTRAYPTEQ